MLHGAQGGFSLCFAVSVQQPACPVGNPYDLSAAIEIHLIFITPIVLCLPKCPSFSLSFCSIHKPHHFSLPSPSLYHPHLLFLLFTYLSLYLPSISLSLSLSFLHSFYRCACSPVSYHSSFVSLYIFSSSPLISCLLHSLYFYCSDLQKKPFAFIYYTKPFS